MGMILSLKAKTLFLFLAVLCLASTICLADVDPSTPADASEFWNALLALLGGIKGLSVKAAVIAVVQLVVLYFRTPLANWVGKWKLSLVLGLTLVLSVVTESFAGLDLLQIVFSPVVLGALQVFANQLIKQFTEPAKVVPL